MCFVFFFRGGGGGGDKTLSLLSKVNSEICHCFISDSYSPMLIVGTTDAIVTFELQNNSLTRKRLFTAENVASLECGHDKRHIYWSNRIQINELSLDAGFSVIVPFHPDPLNSVASPNSLAFDWINHKLYWTDAKHSVIYLGDLQYRRRVRVIEGKHHMPKAIAVSSSDG